jgi:endonuclease/exonuclease/phosphatase family metal-dependent hydrolase
VERRPWHDPCVTELRVASFNIRNGRAVDGCRSWPLRRRAMLAVIERLDADVLGLQEVYGFQLRWLRRRLPAYDVVWTGRGPHGGGEGCPVLVRRAFGRITAHRTVWFGDGPQRPGMRLEGARFPRIVTTARIDAAATGLVLQIANAHLDERSADRRRRSAEQLLAVLDRSIPQVVTGDLNANPDSEVLDVVLRGGLRNALPPTAGGTVHGFTGRVDGRRIDHVLVDDRFEVLDAEVRVQPRGERLASDHWPVVATLRVRDQDPRT